MNQLKIKVIGLGGIGSQLVEQLCQFLHYYKIGLAGNENFAREMGVENPPIYDIINITLIDGDSYEPRNRERQIFSRVGPKAEVKMLDLMEKYDSLSYSFVNEYVTEHNIQDIIGDGDVVFLCVDNHPTRRIVNDYCMIIPNIYLFSGGNGFHRANVQRYIRRKNVDLRPNLCRHHSEIEESTDGHPNTMGCEALAQVEPQMIFANGTAALALCTAFYTEIILGIDTEISDVYSDLINGQTLSKKFPV